MDYSFNIFQHVPPTPVRTSEKPPPCDATTAKLIAGVCSDASSISNNEELATATADIFTFLVMVGNKKEDELVRLSHNEQKDAAAEILAKTAPNAGGKRYDLESLKNMPSVSLALFAWYPTLFAVTETERELDKTAAELDAVQDSNPGAEAKRMELRARHGMLYDKLKRLLRDSIPATDEVKKEVAFDEKFVQEQNDKSEESLAKLNKELARLEDKNRVSANADKIPNLLQPVTALAQDRASLEAEVNATLDYVSKLCTDNSNNNNSGAKKDDKKPAAPAAATHVDPAPRAADATADSSNSKDDKDEKKEDNRGSSSSASPAATATPATITTTTAPAAASNSNNNNVDASASEPEPAFTLSMPGLISELHGNWQKTVDDWKTRLAACEAAAGKFSSEAAFSEMLDADARKALVDFSALKSSISKCEGLAQNLQRSVDESGADDSAFQAGFAIFDRERKLMLQWCRQQRTNLDAIVDPDELQEFCASLLGNHNVMERNVVGLLEMSEPPKLLPRPEVQVALAELSEVWLHLHVSAMERLQRELIEIHDTSRLEDEVRAFAPYSQKAKTFLTDFQKLLSAPADSHSRLLMQPMVSAVEELLEEGKAHDGLTAQLQDFVNTMEGLRENYLNFRRAVLSRVTFLHGTTPTISASLRRRDEYARRLTALGDWVQAKSRGEPWSAVKDRLGKLQNMIDDEIEMLKKEATEEEDDTATTAKSNNTANSASATPAAAAPGAADDVEEL